MKMNTIYQEVMEEVSKKESNSMSDISLICGKIMYRELINYDEKFHDDKGDYDFQKLTGFFKEKVDTMKESNEKKN